MQEVLNYLEANRQTFVSQLVELLRFPSVSADPAYRQGVAACAEHVRAKLASLGFGAELVKTAGHPIVFASYARPENRAALLVYGHYDVQPVDPLDLWNHPPFEPHIENNVVFARGATDDKGQFLAHVLAAEAFLRTRGRLPVNLKFLIEGEEETAADNLERFIKENAAKLEAGGAVVSDGAMYSRDLPAITYGLRGIAGAELIVTGPSKDLHSGGFGGAVANPATELARIIATFHRRDRRVAIAGFYSKVKPLAKWERDMFGALPFDEAEFLGLTGSPQLCGEPEYTTLERLWGRPTCEINGIFGGYQGEGGKTIIPSRAGCKVTMRLVPEQDPDEILEKFERHVAKIASAAVKVEVRRGGGAKPAVVSKDSFLVKAGMRAAEKAFGARPVLNREGGSIPVVTTFKDVLGLDTLLLGFGQRDDNAHSPNEKFSLADFQRGIVTAALLFEELGTAGA